MNSTRLFRAMIAAVWLLPFAGLAADAASGGLSRSLPDFPDLPPAGWLGIAIWTTGIAAFVALLIASAGLWLFQSWARFVYIPAAIIYTLVRPFTTPYPFTHWGDLIAYLDYALEGAMITAAFLPPISAHFRDSSA